MWTTIGHSVENRPIEACSLRFGNPVALVFGGFHGDEPKSVDIARRLAHDRAGCGSLPVDWIIVPLVNPDGYQRRTRRNARKIDLNRNFPTTNWAPGPARSRMYGGAQPASEPETRTVIQLIESVSPDWIVTIHSISGGRHCNNYDGPARELADRMSRYNRYRVEPSIGYPTPGSFGSWAGIEQDIPTVTLELPTSRSARRCWEDNRPALLAVEHSVARNA